MSENSGNTLEVAADAAVVEKTAMLVGKEE
jgi:hypothetical protein